jgi:membrane associated rhomboid family serine protease/Flp pilus assembly protein TadD
MSFKKICQWCVHHEAVQRGEESNAPQPVMAAPWVGRGEASITLTQVLFGANVAVFLAMAFASSSVMDFPGSVLYWGANVGPYTLSGQWWRLVSYMFLHGGLLHIAFNMWCLWDLGALCESLYGRWTFAAIYLITGIAGGLASVAWNPHVLSVGASGAIFGLAGALVSSFYLGEFSLPRVAIGGTLKSLLVFVGFNLFFGGVVGGIDNACHIGGLVSGLILGALIARLAPDPNALSRRGGILLLVALVLAGSALGVQRWRGFPTRFALGLPSLSESDPDQMISALQKKVQRSPDDAASHYALARAYFAKRQLDKSETELKRVLELQPQNAKARRDLGAALLGQERPKEAHTEFAKLLTQEPNNPEAHVWLGMALAAEQNPEAAIKEYETALQLDPQAEDEYYLYYKIGISQSQLKHYDDAIASYLKERDKSGDDPALEDALADAYQTKGMTQQAQEARSKAAQLKGQTTD